MDGSDDSSYEFLGAMFGLSLSEAKVSFHIEEGELVYKPSAISDQSFGQQLFNALEAATDEKLAADLLNDVFGILSCSAPLNICFSHFLIMLKKDTGPLLFHRWLKAGSHSLQKHLRRWQEDFTSSYWSHSPRFEI